MLADLVWTGWEALQHRAAITAGSRRARRFGSFGEESVVCFPPAALYGEQAIHLGHATVIGPYVALSAGLVPGQDLMSDRIVTIGDRCVIGRQSSIAGHLEVVIEDDVYFGPNVFVTDQNHATDQADLPIGAQSEPERPVRIGAGSWLGTNVVVLPGVTIGARCVVGAGAVVTRDLPPASVAVGVPARPVDQTHR